MRASIAGQEFPAATIATLRRYCALVERWSPRINLVARSTLDQLWDRHIVDSAQLFSLAADRAGLWADLGSGGGFPGIVLAILSRDHGLDARHVLVESDRRKGEFLRHVIAELGLSATVITSRIEDIAPLEADVVTARALAALDELLAHCARHLAVDGIALLPKGRQGDDELAQAAMHWRFTVARFFSITEQDAVVFRISDLRRRDDDKVRSR